MILIVSATSGTNLTLANTLNQELLSQGAQTKTINLEDFALPLYTPVAEKDGIPGSAQELTKLFSQANGFVFCAPEYNGSIPPIFNNAVAWISRSGDKDWRAAFNSKFAVVATHSGGGGIFLSEALRSQLQYLGCNVLARTIVTNAKKELNPKSAKDIMTQLITYSER